MELKTLFFTDLDDTLVQSAHKIPEGIEKEPFSKSSNDEYIGFSNGYQSHLLQLMNGNGIVIPVTGRNKRALDRCDWTWSSYQVVSHGAIVLNQKGEICKDWLEIISPEVKEAKSVLESIKNQLFKITKSSEFKKLTSEDFNLRIIEDQGVPTYLCGKQKSNTKVVEALSLEAKNIIESMSLPKGWRLHVNGRNFAILPPYASKARAVAFVKKQLEVSINDLTIGLGDSMSDLEFMNECHLWVTPTLGQINQFLKNEDHSGVK